VSLVLVDTSIWVEVLRKKQPLDLEALVSIEDVVTCLPIVQEVFQGIRDDRAFGIARDAMAHLPTSRIRWSERFSTPRWIYTGSLGSKA